MCKFFGNSECGNMSLGMNLSKYVSPCLFLWHCEFQLKMPHKRRATSMGLCLHTTCFGKP